jgi:hypothetical protein
MSDLPEDVTSFIDQHIASAMALEVLLHLAKHDRAFEPAELSSQLGGSPYAVILSLNELQQHGLVAPTLEDDVRFRYEPKDEELDRVVQLLAQTYARRKVAVITRIFDRPDDDLRSFSDAFKFRKR